MSIDIGIHLTTVIESEIVKIDQLDCRVESASCIFFSRCGEINTINRYMAAACRGSGRYILGADTCLLGAQIHFEVDTCPRGARAAHGWIHCLDGDTCLWRG